MAGSCKYCYLYLVLPKGWALHFALLNFMRFLSVYFFSLSRSLLIAAQDIYHYYWFYVISKLAKHVLCPVIQIIKESVEQGWIQY